MLERLNASLKPKGLFFPVDISTGSRATIGGMTANNSCGARSLRYGNMVHNVRAIDAILADGTKARFGEVPGNFDESVGPERYRDLVRSRCARSTAARRTRSRRASRSCCAGSAATTST